MPKDLNNLQAWEEKQADTAKIGGDNAGDIVGNCRNIARQSKTKKKLIAVSAIRSSKPEAARFKHPFLDEISKEDEERSNSAGFNTTDHLNAIAKALELNDEKQTALGIVDKIQAFTEHTVQTNLEQDSGMDQAPFMELVAEQCGLLRKLIENFGLSDKDRVLDLGRDQVLRIGGDLVSITSFGENLARDLHSLYFNAKQKQQTKKKPGLRSETITGEGLLDSLKETGDSGELQIQKPRAKKLRRTVQQQVITSITERIHALLEETDVIFAGGYAPVLAYEKGFSELVAAVLAGAAADADLDTSLTVEKQDVLMSGDPRVLELYGLKAKPLLKVSHALAQNLMHETAANSGVIQGPGLAQALSKGVEIFVIDPNNLSPDNITRIYNFEAEPGGVDNVSLRAAETVSINLTQHPLLDRARLGAILTLWAVNEGLEELVKGKIGSTVSVTVASGVTAKKLEKLQRVINRDYEGLEVNVTGGKTALFCSGNNMARPGVASDVTSAFKAAGLNIGGINQGDDNQHQMVYIFPKEDAKLAKCAVHRLCIDMTPEEVDASVANGVSKKDLVADLVARHKELQAEGF